MNSSLITARIPAADQSRIGSWNKQRTLQTVSLLFVWGLAFASFSLPGRMAPESASGLDAIAALKMALRMGTLIWVVVYATYFLDSFASRDSVMLKMYLPWAAFLFWACFSVLWSPLKSISIGQVIGLAALLGLSWIVANQFSTVQSAGRLAKSLNRMLLIYSAILLVVYIIAPEATGLHRTSRLHSADGLVHPTAAGATASLGLILASGLYILRIESRAWMVIGCFIQAAILLIARSRASILCATIVLPILVTTLAGRHWLGRILLGTAFCLSALLIVDPGFQSVENLTEAAFSFIRRGQTTQQLASGSGRFELWVAIVDEFKHSPIIGHGYFITSRTGEINAWDGPSNRDAHNVALQVLATMGVVGMSLLFWALWRWLIHLFSIAIHGGAASGLGKLVLLVCLWYGIWGLGCTTFLGPVRPESVVFFCLVGMTIGLNRCLRNSASSHGRRVAT